MANSNLPPDPPPSISAAELRRRLLASTPPPIAASSSDTPSGDLPLAEPAAPNYSTGSSQDMLARLRMPGKPGSGSVPTPRSVTPPPAASEPLPPLPLLPPPPSRPSVSRRTPAPARVHGNDSASAIAGALNQLAGVPEGSGRHQLDDSPMAEIQRLRAENKELRILLDEMKHLLQEASTYWRLSDHCSLIIEHRKPFPSPTTAAVLSR